ncbi:MAG: WbuC family cupin fold metalloprotein [Chromatiales bacterium]|nr:WbuC family cupin fold metalloprotein [Gammaproteobacteria bacterium]
MKLFDKTVTRQLIEDSRSSPRLRAHHCFHPSPDASVQRLAMAMQPGTYYRPHRHADPATWETLLVLQGELAYLTFDDSGVLLSRTELKAGGPVHGVELPEGAWHGLVALAPDTVVFEFKEGPFKPVAEENFAAWAPLEGSAEAVPMEQWYRTAQPGNRVPAL